MHLFTGRQTFSPWSPGPIPRYPDGSLRTSANQSLFNKTCQPSLIARGRCPLRGEKKIHSGNSAHQAEPWCAARRKGGGCDLSVLLDSPWGVVKVCGCLKTLLTYTVSQCIMSSEKSVLNLIEHPFRQMVAFQKRNAGLMICRALLEYGMGAP